MPPIIRADFIRHAAPVAGESNHVRATRRCRYINSLAQCFFNPVVIFCLVDAVGNCSTERRRQHRRHQPILFQESANPPASPGRNRKCRGSPPPGTYRLSTSACHETRPPSRLASIALLAARLLRTQGHGRAPQHRHKSSSCHALYLAHDSTPEVPTHVMLIARGLKSNPRIPRFSISDSDCRRASGERPIHCQLIDQTLLKPEATSEDIVRLCREAAEHHFYSVCINPYWVRLAARLWRARRWEFAPSSGSLWAPTALKVKTAEARLALAGGRHRNRHGTQYRRPALGDFAPVRNEIAELAGIAHAVNALLKVILETCLLSDEQKLSVPFRRGSECRLS